MVRKSSGRLPVLRSNICIHRCDKRHRKFHKQLTFATCTHICSNSDSLIGIPELPHMSNAMKMKLAYIAKIQPSEYRNYGVDRYSYISTLKFT